MRIRDKRFTHKKNRENALKMLQRVVNILNQHQIEYYLDFGTLLGAMRDKAFIPWDDDIDISLLHKEDYSKIQDILKTLNSKYKYRTYLKTIQEDVAFASTSSNKIAKLRNNIFWIWGRGKTSMDIFFKYKFDNELYWIANEQSNKVNADFLDKGLMEIDFYNIRCKVPVEFDAYLSLLYGNWQVADKTWTENQSITQIK
jgi:phosphorylcholine metabolism protein LicD